MKCEEIEISVRSDKLVYFDITVPLLILRFYVRVCLCPRRWKCGVQGQSRGVPTKNGNLFPAVA